MRISRRGLLRSMAAAGAGTALASSAKAHEGPPSRPDAVGMLFDATLCVGCRACQSACKAATVCRPIPSRPTAAASTTPRST